MRLLLDEHLSSQALIRPLRERGHDVLAVGEKAEMWSFEDELLFKIALGEERVLVTCNVRDFIEVAGRWSGAGRPHAGCLLLVGVGTGEFGVILRVISRAAERCPRQEDWCDVLMVCSRQDQ